MGCEKGGGGIRTALLNDSSQQPRGEGGGRCQRDGVLIRMCRVSTILYYYC